MRPMAGACHSANHSAPSAPTVMPAGPDDHGKGKYVSSPPVPMRPMHGPPYPGHGPASVNQMAPSGPAVSASGGPGVWCLTIGPPGS